MLPMAGMLFEGAILGFRWSLDGSYGLRVQGRSRVLLTFALVKVTIAGGAPGTAEGPRDASSVETQPCGSRPAGNLVSSNDSVGLLWIWYVSARRRIGKVSETRRLAMKRVIKLMVPVLMAVILVASISREAVATGRSVVADDPALPYEHPGCARGAPGPQPTRSGPGVLGAVADWRY